MTTIHDINHPHWCRPEACELSGQTHDDWMTTHRSSAAMFPAGDVEVRVRLTRFDERNPRRKGVQSGAPEVEVSLLNVALDGVFADARLTPDQARMMASLLVQYARRAEGFSIDCGSADLVSSSHSTVAGR